MTIAVRVYRKSGGALVGMWTDPLRMSVMNSYGEGTLDKRIVRLEIPGHEARDVQIGDDLLVYFRNRWPFVVPVVGIKEDAGWATIRAEGPDKPWSDHEGSQL